MRSNRIINNFFSYLLPSEATILLYFGLTGILILVFQSRLENAMIHLLYRIFALALIVLLIILNTTLLKSEVFKTLRLFLPFLFLGPIYKETDYLNNLIFINDFDPFFSTIEYIIFGCQPSILFSIEFNNNFFAELMYFGYFSYYLMVIGVPLYLYFRVGKNIGEKFVFIIILSFIIYYIIFIILPVAGPQYYFKNDLSDLHTGYLFGHLISIIQSYGEGPTAAFPSSHVSIYLIIVWASFKHAKKLMLITIPIAFLLIMATVYIRAHYLIDVMAAFIITPIIFMVSESIYNTFVLRKINSVE